MRSHVRHVLLTASFTAALLTGLPLVQAQTTGTEFTPQVGQAGKDVIWVPTPKSLVEKMLKMAEVKPTDVVFDLGSGDGITVITAAKQFGVRATGTGCFRPASRLRHRAHPRARAGKNPRDAGGRCGGRRHRRARDGRPAGHPSRAVARVHAHGNQPSRLDLGAAHHDDLGPGIHIDLCAMATPAGADAAIAGA